MFFRNFFTPYHKIIKLHTIFFYNFWVFYDPKIFLHTLQISSSIALPYLLAIIPPSPIIKHTTCAASAYYCMVWTPPCFKLVKNTLGPIPIFTPSTLPFIISSSTISLVATFPATIIALGKQTRNF